MQKILSHHKRTLHLTLSLSHLNNLGSSRVASTWVFWRWTESTTHTQAVFWPCRSNILAPLLDLRSGGPTRWWDGGAPEAPVFLFWLECVGVPTHTHSHMHTNTCAYTGWSPESLEWLVSRSATSSRQPLRRRWPLATRRSAEWEPRKTYWKCPVGVQGWQDGGAFSWKQLEELTPAMSELMPPHTSDSRRFGQRGNCCNPFSCRPFVTSRPVPFTYWDSLWCKTSSPLI